MGPDSQLSERSPERGDMNITSQVKDKTNPTINELLELGVQLISKVVIRGRFDKYLAYKRATLKKKSI